MANLSLRSIESSNLPAQHKSSLRRLFDHGMARHGGTLSRVKAHAVGGAHAMRKGGEGILTGAALGAASVHLAGGLDFAPTDKFTVPVDAVLGVAGLAASVALAHEPFADDMANVGMSALSIFAYRKSADYMAKRKAASPAHGDFGADKQDRIIALARQM